MEHASTAIILAGGKSKRMGFDKEFMVLNEELLLDTLCATLKTIFRQIVLVSNSREPGNANGLEVIRDELQNLGPLGGIHAGLKAARSQYSYVIACDMPNVNLEYVAFLKNQLPRNNKQISALVTAFGPHLEPFNAFYSRDLIEPICRFAGDGKRSLTAFLRLYHAVVIGEEIARSFSPDWSMFANLNTPEDYEAYRLSNRI